MSLARNYGARPRWWPLGVGSNHLSTQSGHPSCCRPFAFQEAARVQASPPRLPARPVCRSAPWGSPGSSPCFQNRSLAPC